MRRILLTLTIMLSTIDLIHSQEILSNMSESQRNAELTRIAKATFQKEMPEVYREYGKATFEQGTINYSPTSYDSSFYGEQYGDIYYIVTFPLNPETEKNLFIGGFACKVHIWNDTKEAFLIEYGNTEEIFKLLSKRARR